MNRVTFCKIKSLGKPERLVPIVYPSGESRILRVNKQLRFSKGINNIIMLYDGTEYETNIPSSLINDVEIFYPIKYSFGIDEKYYNELLKKVM